LTSTCGCKYKTENCDASDGWVDTGEKRQVPCVDNPCKLCEEKKQQFRDFSCAPDSCVFEITNERWVSTGNRFVKQCPTGQFCENGICRPPPTCEEQDMTLSLSKIQLCPKPEALKVNITGVNACKSKKVLFKLDGCDPEDLQLRYCIINSKGQCVKTVYINPHVLGVHNIFACMDKNKDGDFNDPGEQTSVGIDLDCNNCNKYQCRIAPTCDYCSSSETCINDWQTC